MGQQAQVQMRAAVDAFADGDLALAAALPDMDDVMDDLQKDLFRAILTADADPPDEGMLQRAVQMALVGRYYERVADHAVQIGRWVAFMVTGDLPRPGDEPVERLTACAGRLLAFVVAEVPFEDEVLALGIAGDPLAVAAELRVVRREQLQAGLRPLRELLDRLGVAEHAVNLPVGRDRTEVDDADVPLRRDVLELLGFHGHRTTLPGAIRRARARGSRASSWRGGSRG